MPPLDIAAENRKIQESNAQTLKQSQQAVERYRAEQERIRELEPGEPPHPEPIGLRRRPQRPADGTEVSASEAEALFASDVNADEDAPEGAADEGAADEGGGD